ncbi:hypothetical protein [Mycolicibacterium elephantis]|uniref:hypothetical protein n=1 Tax=Mycolicibacterium elephantis TaxID=81858 RepID=UPI0007EAC499|nr:hypothetical protein [Mycolicibacterium elephantis]OBB20621.1 hypothetical protein A5762_15305 [Mycolicibacterium elephantis]
MTTPGGVPNLPVGALTLDTLAEKTQDTTPAAMRVRAAERMPSTFNSSNGGNPLVDLSPFGIITQLWAGFNSHVANADPADIEGPEDLPGLLLDFIEELPVIGGFVQYGQEVIDLIQRLLAPFGGNVGESAGLDDALNLLLLTLAAPLQAISSLQEFLGNALGQQQAQIASLEDRIAALTLGLDGGVAENGVFDNAKTVDNLTDVLGTMVSFSWGAWTSSSAAVARYNTAPATDRQLAGIRVKAKTIGQSGVDICSDAAATNYARLLLDVKGNGEDQVSVVTGTGPLTTVTRKSLTMRLPTDTWWSIAYEPDDEESETSNTFHVFMNGRPVEALRWQDAGNVVLHGDGQREVGPAVNLLSHPTRRGFAVADFTAYDWLGSAPE